MHRIRFALLPIVTAAVGVAPSARATPLGASAATGEEVGLRGRAIRGPDGRALRVRWRPGEGSAVPPLDVRGPVGLGTDGGGRARLTFDLEHTLVAVTEDVGVHLVFGLGGRAPGLLAVRLGTGVEVHAGGGLVTLSVLGGMGWRRRPGTPALASGATSVAWRGAYYPRYQTQAQLTACARGCVVDGVLSGAGIWVEAGVDWFGRETLPGAAVGGSLDMGRALVLPLVRALTR